MEVVPSSSLQQQWVFIQCLHLASGTCVQMLQGDEDDEDDDGSLFPKHQTEFTFLRNGVLSLDHSIGYSQSDTPIPNNLLIQETSRINESRDLILDI